MYLQSIAPLSEMLELINKMKGRSRAELSFRGRQAFAAFSERHGFSSQSALPSDAALLDLLDLKKFSDSLDSQDNLLTHFRSRSSPRFFAAFDDPDSTMAELRAQFEVDRKVLLARADKITNGHFQLLGISDLNFGDPIDWHLEPLSDKRSPMIHWSLINEIDSETSGDKRIVWELNRHQYFTTLGRAFWLTGNAVYAETFVQHLDQWMDRNPPKFGINWMSSLEIAYRAISWLWGLHFFKDSTQLTSELYARALKYLYLHARHLETFLSTYSSPNTHLTGEALGLFYLGTLLPEFRRATIWKDLGKSILIDELSRHVLTDGVYFERASYYHRYTTDFYTHFLVLSERNGEKVEVHVKEKLSALLDHMMYLTRPDGTTPFIGDDDGGRLVMLDDREPSDFRSSLSTGAVLLSRGEYKFVAGEVAESTLWLLGRDGVQAYNQIIPRAPQTASQAFPDGGYYVMRDGWTADANFLILDCGPHGVLNCGHAHADALSFELAARGRKLLVDPGTYTYTGSKELRDYFRSSAAHNTLTIDGESSSVPDGPFSWKETANAAIITWKSEARFDFVEGAHDGYKNLKRGAAAHTRSVLFIKNDYWVMRDFVETEGSHHYEQHFHFAVGAEPHLKQMADKIVSLVESATDKSGLQVFAFGDKGDWRIENGWVSSTYGERTIAPVCTFYAEGTGPQEFVSFLIPRYADDVHSVVREIKVTGGRGFDIRSKETYDTLLIGNGSLIETDRITTDFKWAWTRLSSDAESIAELILIDGRSFSFDGQELLNSPNVLDYVVARRDGDKLVLETEKRTLEVVLPVEDLVAVSSINDREADI